MLLACLSGGKMMKRVSLSLSRASSSQVIKCHAVLHSHADESDGRETLLGNNVRNGVEIPARFYHFVKELQEIRNSEQLSIGSLTTIECALLLQ